MRWSLPTACLARAARHSAPERMTTHRGDSLDTAMADHRKRAGAVAMTVAIEPLAPTDAKNSCIRIAARPSPDARSGASRRGKAVASVTATGRGGGAAVRQVTQEAAAAVAERAPAGGRHMHAAHP